MANAVKLHVKKGDTVLVLSGKDKGKQGKIVEALKKSRSGLKILNLNKLLPSGKNRNYRKSRKHWISFSKISLCCSMLLKSIQTYFRQNGNLFLSQEINKIALTTQLFSSKSSQGFRPISSQVTPYGAPPEV